MRTLSVVDHPVYIPSAVDVEVGRKTSLVLARHDHCAFALLIS